MKKRLILPFILPACLMGLVAINGISNETSEMEPASVSLIFPTNAHIRGWIGTPKQESPEERRILAEDTEFSKMEYVEEEPITLSYEDHKPRLTAQASIVLSGHDMNNSIHRPEYCLPAQGHFDIVSERKEIDVKSWGKLPITQLDSLQNITPNSKTPTLIRCLHYYIFIGNKQVTNNHIERLLLDLKDRILFGKVQRWAYFQISTPYGEKIGRNKEDAQRQTEQLIDQILSQIIDWESIKNN